MGFCQWENVQGVVGIELAAYKGQLVTEEGEAIPEVAGIIAPGHDAEVVIYFRSSGSFRPAVLYGENPSPPEWSEDRTMERIEVSEWDGRQQVAVHKLTEAVAKAVWSRFQDEVWETVIEFQNHDDYDYDDDYDE